MPGSHLVNQTLTVFLAATATAAATGLGALPFAFRRFQGERILGVSNALAAGVMLGASASLLIEGADRSIPRVVAGLAAGAVFVLAMERLFSHLGTPEIGHLVGVDARKALLIIAVMTAHSAAEGVGLGASFGGSDALGLAITIAIAIHNIPEGVTISLVMVPGARRSSARRCGASSRASLSRCSRSPPTSSSSSSPRSCRSGSASQPVR